MRPDEPMLHSSLDDALYHWCREIYRHTWFDLRDGNVLRMNNWSRVATVMSRAQADAIPGDKIFWTMDVYRISSYHNKPMVCVRCGVGEVLVHASGAFRVLKISEYQHQQWLAANDPPDSDAFHETAEDYLAWILSHRINPSE